MIIEKLLDHFRDPDLLEVLINSHRSLVLVGKSEETLDSPFSTPETCLDEIFDFVWSQNQRLDSRLPFAGGIYQNTWRWHAIIPPLAFEGPLFSLRRHRMDSIRLEDFATNSGDIAEIRQAFVENKHIIICGPTGSGKTTFLCALLKTFASQKRVVILEQIPEITLVSRSWVRLVANPPDVEQFGEIKLRTALDEALRIRPDYLVIGEVRGIESECFYLAATTGHGSIMTTMHANSADQVRQKLKHFIGEGFLGLERMNIKLVFLRRGMPPVIAGID